MIKKWDERRMIALPGDKEETHAFCLEHFIYICAESIQDHGAFFVALSGGSTPKVLFEKLSTTHAKMIDWNKVHLFWSDERSVPPKNPDSNYRMAMNAGLQNVGIPEGQIHRMCAETQIEKNAEAYEQTIRETLNGRPFDLIMLGMGDDGHTASLFPKTKALDEETKFVAANPIPQKETTRMTMTYPCINNARHIAIYVLGENKQEMLKTVLTSEENNFETYPSQNVGTTEHPALWIADAAAAKLLPIS